MDSHARQQLLELVYDLLPASEAAELRERIRSDPAWAAAYAEAQEAARLMAEAARLPADAVPLPYLGTPSSSGKAAVAPGGRSAAPPLAKGRRARPLARAANWAVGLTAALLVLFSVGGYLRHRGQLAAISAEQLRLFVVGPAALRAGTDAQFTVTTTSMGGRPLPARIEVGLSVAGKRLKTYKETADEQGRLLVAVPAQFDVAGQAATAVPIDQAQFQVVGWYGKSKAAAEATLPVEPERYWARLTLDRPQCRPGETIRFRLLVLSRVGRPADRPLPVRVAVLDTAGTAVSGLQSELVAVRGHGAGEFAIPPASRGGQYSLVAKSPDGAFADQSCTFLLADDAARRFDEDLEFARDSYGPGQTVVANFEARRLGGAAVAGALLHITATLDGQLVFRDDARTSQSGTFPIEFRLPDTIDPGEGQLRVALVDRGERQSLTRPIPINLRKIEVAFYPEGGELVEGLENRVYFAASTPLGKPVRFSGRLLAERAGEGKDYSDNDRAVRTIETIHDGMGVFSFVPHPGETYRLKITEPEGIETDAKLPAVAPDRELLLTTGTGVFAAGQPIRATILATRPGLPLLVTADCRGMQVGRQAVITRAGERGDVVIVPFDQQAAPQAGAEDNLVTLPLASDADGVIRLSVHDFSAARPKLVAQRLVYRRPAQWLKVQMDGAAGKRGQAPFAGTARRVLRTNGACPLFPTGSASVGGTGLATGRPRYAPGQQVDLPLQVTDEKGQPAAARLSVSVEPTFASAIPVGQAFPSAMPAPPLADKNPCPTRPAALLTDFLLTSELHGVEQLEDADFYLSEGGEAALAEPVAPRGAALAEPAAPRHSQSQRQSGADLAGGDLAGGVPPAVALDLLLGTRGWVAPVKPAAIGEGAPDELAGGGQWQCQGLWQSAEAARAPYVYDNGGQIRAAYETALADYQAGRTVAIDALTAASLFAGLALVLLTAMLSVLRIGSGLRIWIPTVAAAACCLILGTILMDPGRVAPGYGTAVAFASTDAARPVRPAAAAAALSGARSKAADKAPTAELGRIDRGPVTAPQSGSPAQFPAAPAGQAGKAADDAAEGRPSAPQRAAKRQSAREPQAKGGGEISGELTPAPRYGEPLSYHPELPGNGAGGAAGPPEPAGNLYWNPLLEVPADGKALLRFTLPAAPTTCRLTVDAEGGGRIGDGQAEIVSRVPFRLIPDLPPEATVGDRIDALLSARNDGDSPLPLRLRLDYGPRVGLAGLAARDVTLAAGAAADESFEITAGQRGACELAFRGAGGPWSDSACRRLRIIPPGFPRSTAYSGQLDGRQAIVVRLPERAVPGSLGVTLTAFPSVLADLRQAVEGLRRAPGGGFEQACAIERLNVLAMRYLLDHKLADAHLTRLLKDSLRDGYARLAQFECPQGGFGTFAGDRSDPVLTALALSSFHELATVYDLDPAIVRRTAQQLRPGGQASAPADEPAADAYVAWALSECGQPEIQTEVKAAIALGIKSDDPYVVALAGATAMNARDKLTGHRLLHTLAAAQAEDGHVDARHGSATGSEGPSLRMETTALAALAWLKSPVFAPQAQKAVQWILGHRQADGTFGSAPATMLALEAFCQSEGFRDLGIWGFSSRGLPPRGPEIPKSRNPEIPSSRLLTIDCDGRTIGRRSFAAGVGDAIVIDGLETALKPGQNRVGITLTGNARNPGIPESRNPEIPKVPYLLTVAYHGAEPDQSDACPLRLSAKLAGSKLRRGRTVALSAELTNVSENEQPLAVAIVGIPAGLEAPSEQLDALKKAGTIDSYEVRARELIFSWRSLAAGRRIAWQLDLLGALPGKYVGPPSRAYLANAPENQRWCDPLAIEITRD